MAPVFVFAPTALLMMLLTFAGAGVRDLASCLPTDAYWKAKAVVVSLDQLGSELTPAKPADLSRLVADLNADDARDRDTVTEKIAAIGSSALPALEKAAKGGPPEVVTRAKVLMARIRASSKPAAIRRLMAIRTLGELKDSRGLAYLQPLVASAEMFEADYAKAAIAKIQGKTYTFPAVTESQRLAEIGLLPAQIDSIMQAAPELEGQFSLDKTIDQLPLDDNQKLRLKEQAAAKLLTLLETIGNVRIDALTWGFNAAPPTKPGNSIVIARGQFDGVALCDFLGKMIPKSRAMDGSNVYELDVDTVVLVSSDRHIVFLSREAMGDLALEGMTAALNKGAGTFSENVELSKQVKTIDVKAPLWGAASLTPGLAEIVGPLGDFDSATLVGVQRLDQKKNLITDMTLQAASADAAKIKKAAEDTQEIVKMAVEAGRKREQAMPYLKPAVDFVATVKVKSDNAKATATGSLENAPLLPLVLPVQGPLGQ